MKLSSIAEGGILARWLRSRYGQRPLRLIAERIATDLLTAAKEAHPPIDPASILPFRRITRPHPITNLRGERMAQDGRLQVADDGFLLQVKAGPRTRTRFTLAHELAHTTFYDLRSSPPRRILHGATARDEETFCNLLASAILMPEHMVLAQVDKQRSAGPSSSPTGTILGLAETFKVSPETMARRLIEDLGVLHGVALGCRWLPTCPSSSASPPSAWAWRVVWWAASPPVIEPLYLPPVSKRPRLSLDPLEEAFSNGGEVHVRAQLSSVRLGNLRKILREGHEDLEFVDVWAHPRIPAGIQLRSEVGETPGCEDPTALVRRRSEVIAFFPLTAK